MFKRLLVTAGAISVIFLTGCAGTASAWVDANKVLERSAKNYGNYEKVRIDYSHSIPLSSKTVNNVEIEAEFTNSDSPDLMKVSKKVMEGDKVIWGGDNYRFIENKDNKIIVNEKSSGDWADFERVDCTSVFAETNLPQQILEFVQSEKNVVHAAKTEKGIEVQGVVYTPKIIGIENFDGSHEEINDGWFWKLNMLINPDTYIPVEATLNREGENIKINFSDECKLLEAGVEALGNTVSTE